MAKEAVKVIKAAKAGEGVFRNERIWRLLSGIWTIVFILFIVFDFFLAGKYEFLIAPMSAVYLGVLGLYVGTKEFERWYERHQSRHPGEWFVIIWTLIIVGLFTASLLLKGEYRVSPDIIADYIMVLTVFALTQKSKSLYRKKRRSK
mgnify:CR=1 FL=1